MKIIRVKAVGDWELDILGVPFGGPFNGKDEDGQFFDAESNLHLDKFQEIPLVAYHGLDPDSPRELPEPEYIGTAHSPTVKKDGVWYRAVLDKSKETAAQMMKWAREGILKASSGSIAHLVRIARNGHILEWPVAEMTVMGPSKFWSESNSLAVALPVMKSVYKQAGMVLPEGLDDEPEASVRDAAARDHKKLTRTKRYNMSDKELTDRDLVDAEARGREKLQAEIKAKADRQDELDMAVADGVEDAKKAWDEEKKEADEKTAEDAKKDRRLPTEGDDIADKDVYAAKFANTWMYDDLDIGEHALMVRLLQSTAKHGDSDGPTEDNLKALAIKIVENKEDPRAHVRTKMAMKKAGLPLGAAKVANALNQSDLASFGDEWVVTANSSDLWDKIRLGVNVVAQVPSVVIPPGAESIQIPLQSTSATFYTVAQASAQDTNPGPITRTVTTSKMGTANTTLSVGKMGAATYYTGELVEDSIIPWAAELRSDLVTEGAEILEHLVIDGDTETGGTGNINDVLSAPGSTDVFLLFNGFRKLALVTNTANARDGGSLAVEDFLETVKLMGVAGKNAIQKDKVAFIIDLNTHWKALELAKIQSKDVFSAPTIEGASLVSIFGYKVIASANMHRTNQDATYGLQANSAGKVDLDTASNNTKGAILAVRWDQWRMGFKRLMTIETTRVPSADSTELVALMRVGMVYRDTDASAISYNIGV